MDHQAYTTCELELLTATSAPPSDIESARAFLIRGHILRDHNEIELAIESYDVVLQWEPDNEAAFESIVSAHEARRDYECAKEYIIKAWHAGLGLLDGVDFSKYAPPLLARMEKAISRETPRVTASVDNNSCRSPDTEKHNNALHTNHRHGCSFDAKLDFNPEPAAERRFHGGR